MREQLIEITELYAALPELAGGSDARTQYPDAAFWMQVYPPLTDYKMPVGQSKAICPWTLAAELAGTAADARRRNILESLKKGLRTIRQYDLPAYRILFMEHCATREISVWVD